MLSLRLTFFHLPFFFLLFGACRVIKSETVADESKSLVHIGAVFDVDSAQGAIAETCMCMAISDFYDMHSTYQTRLALHTRTSKDLVGTAAAVEDLLKNVKVHAVLGPQISEAAPLVIELGAKAHVPVISFFSTSLNLSPLKNHYFIRAAQDDSVEVKAIAATLQGLGWDEVVIVYEDSDDGNLFISHLVTSLLKNDIGVSYKSAISTTAEDFQISSELSMLMTRKTRVFIVHMTSSLGSRLFALADKVDMMSAQGYVWFITTALSNSLKAMDSMEGVLGIRPHVPNSKDLENFNMRWKSNLHLMKPNSLVTELNISGLWAYDMIWALAMAVERIEVTNSNFLMENAREITVKDFAGSSRRIGPRLVNEMLNIKLKGLSGEFHVVNGQLKTSAFEIFNVTEKGERVVEYWTPDKRISRRLYSRESIRKINTEKYHVPTIHLNIGIPVKTGFNEFVDEESFDQFTGFSIEVFRAAYKKLESKNSISFQFLPFKNATGGMNGSYCELLNQIKKKKYDAVVGDTTIYSNRTLGVDFTMPYSESGMTMLVPIKHGQVRKMWIFLQPWSWDLWLTVFASFIFMGLTIRIMEHRTENITFTGSRNRQLGMTLWFPFSALAIPQRELVVNDWSRFVLVIWIGLAVILMQIYTASLSTMLTVNGLRRTFMSVEELKEKSYKVGYQKDSYVQSFLTDHLGFDNSNLQEVSTSEEYYNALSKGPHKGGVAAIFDEIPYIRVFLSKYGSNYMMAGPIYRTDGFGFAFPKGSRLVSNFSRAILSLIEEGNMSKIETRYFGHEIANLGVASQISPDNDHPRLSTSSLAGLFIIAGFTTLLALVISEGYLLGKPVGLVKQLSKRYLSSQPPNNTELVPQSTAQVNAVENSQASAGDVSTGISCQADENSQALMEGSAGHSRGISCQTDENIW
ncbi:hypothetical protein Ddye_009138 [Dipteronia dyeriana]|uniref:Glutamate receptor n=1 Tax=Dipteronia dyeriana TaxID=168575 RepID=A0AAD9XAS6_9ROSI|nr:hypothetical protein Ddye_009138 [Dipteronia dyeriana]